MEWDVFISHATEDKSGFVIPLVNKLKQYGVKVWFDKFELKVGDSLSKNIDEGLRKSKYGIVIISKSFLNKGWTDYEYRSLLSREIGNCKVILPVWYNITKEEVQQYSLFLSDKMALSNLDRDIDEITESLIEVIRPDIFKIINNIAINKNLINDSMQAYVNFEDAMVIANNMKNNKVYKHEKLTLDTMILLRLIHVIYEELDKMTYEDRVDLYRCNMNPQKEALIEIKNATIYLQKTLNKGYNIGKKRAIFIIVNMLSFNENLSYKEISGLKIGKEEFMEIRDAYIDYKPDTSNLDGELLFMIDKKDNEE
ncbi:toll/interleukin-1 receptor domain-containing protein [Clostridium beijerinckii]|uniref:ADP-ribosyl cyclase/cyclic ADP-ribose hydrolase n=1 Tax=Clostridium beijerinckii TaxID=1520 RepID=A0AAE5EXB4_CLOBE|nr:toll/interleukin-1 receptor domain-containing protein [Clostridium beijerinckii]AQS18339.1 toll/interleukin-1 receptor domain-containing protein [Clostridium beijerinckii NRRL B-598]NSB13044.1 hypothetical protein [Clostridium beijerinckii]OOM22146.1 TIR domain protein [Clostridium beijerinckii]